MNTPLVTPDATVPRVAASADVDPGASLAPDAVVWHLAQVREGAVIGAGSSVGRGAYIGPGVVVGERVKIQNLAQVYEPAVVEDGAFIGPAVVLTNDRHPRSVTPTGALKTGADWEPVGVTVRSGASIGARAVCVAPVVIGRWAMVGAGATVVRDVPAHALVVGAPARQVGWVGRAGAPLSVDSPDGTQWLCPRTSERYRLGESGMELALPI